jgi:outer membrane scaffolding protein for murein synthesis (MipA/OmpV family)
MNRRALLAGLVATGAAVAAGTYRFTDIFVKRYPATPYDDLLTHLGDREQAARLGAAARHPSDAVTLASRLRASVPGDLEAAVQADIAAGRLTEVQGWLLPQTLVLLSALAAKS